MKTLDVLVSKATQQGLTITEYLQLMINKCDIYDRVRINERNSLDDALSQINELKATVEELKKLLPKPECRIDGDSGMSFTEGGAVEYFNTDKP